MDDRRSHLGYHLPNVEVMIDGKNSFDQAMNNDFRRYENIQKTTAGQEDDYATGCLLDYPCFKENYKMIAIDLIKQQALDAYPRKIQHITFTANSDRTGNITMSFIIEEAKETAFDVSQGSVKVL